MATERYLLTIEGSLQGSEMTTSLCFQSDGVTANDTLTNGNDLIAAFQADAEDLWLEFNSTNYVLRRYRARRVNPHGSAVAHLQYATQEKSGLFDEECSPVNLAPAVRLIPGTLGATAGRAFLPPPCVSLVNNNAYDPAYVTLIDSFFQQCIDLLEATFEWHLCIHHKKTDTFSACVGFNLSPRFGFQSRRRYPVA